ncbi:hypothetical protein M5K25_025296 [Dendrobium thyrsiflorum]|uniref:Uncharacterized protein n=1 Tax=Dendrobium thyrsiflorum TaxID=117978 RepID=A0ABD0U426_DENTH
MTSPFLLLFLLALTSSPPASADNLTPACPYPCLPPPLSFTNYPPPPPSTPDYLLYPPPGGNIPYYEPPTTPYMNYPAPPPPNPILPWFPWYYRYPPPPSSAPPPAKFSVALLTAFVMVSFVLLLSS